MKGALNFGMPASQWIADHRNDTVTLGEIEAECEKAKKLYLDMAQQALKGKLKEPDLLAYAFFMQGYEHAHTPLDVALEILAERYGLIEGDDNDETVKN